MDDNDELQALIQKLDILDSSKEQLQLIINPTMDCNLGCWYYYENHIKGSRIFPWVKEAIVNLLNNEITSSQLKRISISFFGGELFLFFDEDVYPLMMNAKKIFYQKIEMEFCLLMGKLYGIKKKENVEKRVYLKRKFVVCVESLLYVEVAVHNYVLNILETDVYIDIRRRILMI